MSGASGSRIVLALFFVAAGANHFIEPALYLSIVPSYLPWRPQLVTVSGVAEILGGLGLLFRPTHRVAAVGLIALLVSVFPANVEALRTGMSIAGHAVPSWALWARLPLQLVLIWWVYLSGLRACRARPIAPEQLRV
ncbi:MAG: DoxX family membrane protein [Verrucomicrobiota bacterium]|nr:DoxX family membrane protein [Verrucomicrobiota bacterium]